MKKLYPSIDAPDFIYDLAFKVACANGNLEVAKWLDSKVNIDFHEEKGKLKTELKEYVCDEFPYIL